MALVSSDPSAAAVTDLALDEFFLVDPVGGDLFGGDCERVKVARRPIRVSDEEDQDVHRPMGSRNHVVIVGEEVSGDRIDIALLFDTEEGWQRFRTLRRRQRTLLLQTDTTDQWYVRLPAQISAEVAMTGSRRTRPLRTVDLSLLEVDAPIGDLDYAAAYIDGLLPDRLPLKLA